MKKNIFMMIMILLIFTGCARFLGEVLDPEVGNFSLLLVTPGNGTIQVVIPRTDHEQRRLTTSGNGTFFRGYYIYRSTESPYADFAHIGVDAFPVDGDNSGFQEKRIGSTVADPWALDTSHRPSFIDNCPDNQIVYYRVAAVYQKYSGSWASELKEEAVSSWKGAACATSLIVDP